MSKEKMNKENDIICRSFGTDYRALTGENNEHRITGHAAVFDQAADIDGWFYEVIDRRAFEKCSFKDVVFCINHDTKKIPLARSRNNNGNNTMQLSIDDKGLAVDALLDTERNADALALYSAVERGDMGGMSFIFRVSDYSWENLDTDMPTKRITGISEVFEVTAATWPYYTGTDVDARARGSLESDLASLESERRKAQSPEGDKATAERAIFEVRAKLGI